MEMVVSIVAVVLSFFSILVALVSAVITYRQNSKLNSINMRAKYFNSIFDEYLITKIPEARKYLRFSENKLVDSQPLSDALTHLLSDALYFRYENTTFYNSLKSKVQEVEDYVMGCGNKTYEQEEQGIVFNTIHEKLAELYKCINDNYIGQ